MKKKNLVQILAGIGLVIAILWTGKGLFQVGSIGYKEVKNKISKSSGLSSEYKKEILDGCIFDATSSLGHDRAKQYCTCTTKMLDKKFTDESLLKVLNMKNQAKQIEIFIFTSNYWNRNAKSPE
mgnify:FL=1